MLLSRDDVARALGLPLKQLTWWVWALREDRRYDSFELKRRGGGAPRQIDAPIKPIKDVQRRLSDLLTDCYEAPVHVHGFVRGRSPLTNARLHQRKQWVLRLDLADFFPTLHFGRVRGMFMAYPFEYPADVATLLAQICCYQGRLPQGAPTSPIVSNFICRRMDTQFGHLARAERCHYTRYADDLCFSTDRKTFPPTLASVASGVTTVGKNAADIISHSSFAININKSRLMRQDQRQRVTGLVVNRKLNVSRDYVRALRRLLYVWRRYGEDDAKASLSRGMPHLNWPPGKLGPDFRDVMRGRVKYVGSVKGWDNPVYLRLAAALSEVDAGFRSGTTEPPPSPDDIQVFTEGPSDVQHLAAAQEYFHARGEFLEFTLVMSDETPRGSDTALLQYCQALAVTRQAQVCLCVFDRDSPRILREVTQQNDWKNWGNRVVSVALVTPAWRAPESGICIEMLYDSGVLGRVDSQGRRLFLLEEFDDATGHHLTEAYTIPNSRNRTLVQEAVHEFPGGRSVGLGKNAFAAAIRSHDPPFASVSFEGFRPSFEVIREAVRDAAKPLADEGSRE